jgi:hypothetical protein
MFAISHPLEEVGFQSAQQSRATPTFFAVVAEDPLSQSDTQSLFHSSATRFPDLKASLE